METLGVDTIPTVECGLLTVASTPSSPRTVQEVVGTAICKTSSQSQIRRSSHPHLGHPHHRCTASNNRRVLVVSIVKLLLAAVQPCRRGRELAVQSWARLRSQSASIIPDKDTHVGCHGCNLKRLATFTDVMLLLSLPSLPFSHCSQHQRRNACRRHCVLKRRGPRVGVGDWSPIN